MVKGLRTWHLCESVELACQGLPNAGVNRDLLTHLLVERRPFVKDFLLKNGLPEDLLDSALAIHLYSIEELRIARAISAVIFSPESNASKFSFQLTSLWPFIKYMDAALIELSQAWPDCVVSGRTLYRPIKWASPPRQLRKHESVYFYQPRWAVIDCPQENEYNTLLELSVIQAYDIGELDARHETVQRVLFRPLANFDVVYPEAPDPNGAPRLVKMVQKPEP
eukprot:c15590_g1_i1.p1 GENE.c15590_g1_i1~~c15590_g1_i1.p1  ORF type:complete len:223 (+),score=35.85 c15590_g1_i1:495-1163(+)